MLTFKSKLIIKLMYFIAGALLGLIFYHECIQNINTEYMKTKFEYLQKNDIDSFKEECKKLDLSCDIFFYKKDGASYAELYLENIKISKLIGVE